MCVCVVNLPMHRERPGVRCGGRGDEVMPGNAYYPLLPE